MADKKEAIAQAMVDAAIAGLKANGADAASMETLQAIAGAPGAEQGKAFIQDDDAYVTVYSCHDGSTSRVLVSMLGKILRKRFSSIQSEVDPSKWGTPVFSLTPTEVTPRQSLLCRFHKDSAVREELDAMGLAGTVCVTNTIPTENDVRLHAEHRHRQENQVYTEAVKKAEHDEERDFQRGILELLLAQAKESKKGK